jgi:hypothetical protein
MKRHIVILTLIVALLASVVAPPLAGQTSAAAPAQNHPAAVHNDSHASAFDKTRFLAHLAVAAFLVHYIYKKFKQGKLGRFHILTDIKAAIAALLAYHEIKKAYDIAKTSKSKTLQLLIAPITALTSTLGAMASKLKHGDTSQISTANGQENLLQSTAGSNGFGYKDQQPSGFKGF